MLLKDHQYVICILLNDSAAMQAERNVICTLYVQLVQRSGIRMHVDISILATLYQGWTAPYIFQKGSL